LKTKIKFILFLLNRFFGKIYFRLKVLSSNGINTNQLRLLFIVDDTLDEKKCCPLYKKITNWNQINSKITVKRISEIFENTENPNFESLFSKIENFDFVWLDIGKVTPIEKAINALNDYYTKQIDREKIFTFDTLNFVNSYPFFKPNFSPELFDDIDYLEGAVFFPKSIFLDINISNKLNFLELYTYLILKFYNQSNQFIRIPEIGFIAYKIPKIEESHHKRIQFLLNQKINNEDHNSIEIPNTILQNNIPLISIIIPFRDKVELLKVVVDSIIQKSKYQKFELVLVSNQSQEKETLQYLKFIKKEYNNIIILKYDQIFNFSAMNNFAAERANGELLFFLNNDTEAISEDFLEKLSFFALKKHVGAVGPKLLFEDGKIQHAGVILGLTGLAEHAFKDIPDHDGFDSFGSAQWTRNYLAVTAAALMIEKRKFNLIGGFNEKLVVCGNDVDLGIRLYEAGFRNVYLPSVKLFHFESKSRKGSKIPEGDYLESIKSYGKYLKNGDPYFHPCLNLTYPWLSFNFSDKPSHKINLEKMKKLMSNIFINSGL